MFSAESKHQKQQSRFENFGGSGLELPLKRKFRFSPVPWYFSFLRRFSGSATQALSIHDCSMHIQSTFILFYTKVHYIPEYVREVVAGPGCSADLKGLGVYADKARHNAVKP